MAGEPDEKVEEIPHYWKIMFLIIVGFIAIVILIKKMIL